MTVKELIAELQQLNPEMDVVYSGETCYASKLSTVFVEEWPCTWDGEKFAANPGKAVFLHFDEGANYSQFEG